jgi:hypothetical protein
VRAQRHVLEHALRAKALAQKHAVKKELLQAKVDPAQLGAGGGKTTPAPPNRAARADLYECGGGYGSACTSSAARLMPGQLGSSSLGSSRLVSPALAHAPVPSTTASALTTASTSPSGSASPPHEAEREPSDVSTTASGAARPSQHPHAYPTPPPPLPPPPPPLTQRASDDARRPPPVSLPRGSLPAEGFASPAASLYSLYSGCGGALPSSSSGVRKSSARMDACACAGNSLPQTPLLVPGARDPDMLGSPRTLGTSLALARLEMERRPGHSEDETQRRLRLLHEAAERRARFERKPEIARERAEAAAAAAHALACQMEESRQQRAKAHRDELRARMREKVGARDRAKAQELLLSLRRTVRLELRRGVAATRLQAHARRLLAHRRVLQVRETRTQGRLCATQAAWRARSFGSFSEDAPPTPEPEPEPMRRQYGVIPEGPELVLCERALSSCGALKLDDSSVGRFEWTVVGLPFLSGER